MLKVARDKQGWNGWCGGELYTAPKGIDPVELDRLLQLKAKETCTGAAVVGAEHCVYGWGYTDERYLDGPNFWSFYLLSDTFYHTRQAKLYIEHGFNYPLVNDTFGAAIQFHAYIRPLNPDNPHVKKFVAFVDGWLEHKEGVAYVSAAFLDMLAALWPTPYTRQTVPDLERIQEIEVEREQRKKQPLPLP